MKKVILLILLFLSGHLYSQETEEFSSSNKTKLELLLEIGGNNTRFNLPTTGFNFTTVTGYGASLDAGLLWMKLDPSQPLDLVASGRLGYSSHTLQSDTDSLDINRSAKGLSLEGGFGLHHREILFFTLNLGYFKTLSDSEQTTDGFLGGIKVMVKIPTKSNFSIGFNGMIGGFFKNVVFKEFQSEGLFMVKGGVVVGLTL